MTTELTIAILESPPFLGADGEERTEDHRAYVDGIIRAHGRVKVVSPPEGEVAATDAATKLDGVQGIVLIGGGDIHPFWYHQVASADLREVDVKRDEWEIACVHYAISRQIPCLGICRGLELINVALGGSLVQQLPERGTHETQDQLNVTNQITVDRSSRLFGGIPTETMSVVCHHHQGLQTIGGEMQVIARSSDGLVEACERWQGGHWIGGVQWHPERTAKNDPVQQEVFDRFVTYCHGTVLSR